MLDAFMKGSKMITLMGHDVSPYHRLFIYNQIVLFSLPRI